MNDQISYNISYLKTNDLIHKGTFRLGDIIQFQETSLNIIALATIFYQKFIYKMRKQSDEYNHKTTHSAIVIGETIDHIPIICHMTRHGLEIQRMDACMYKKNNFNVIRAQEQNLGEKMARIANRDIVLTTALSETGEEFIKHMNRLKSIKIKNVGLLKKIRRSNAIENKEDMNNLIDMQTVEYFRERGLLQSRHPDGDFASYPRSQVQLAHSYKLLFYQYSKRNVLRAFFKRQDDVSKIHKYETYLAHHTYVYKLKHKLNKAQFCSQFIMNIVKAGLAESILSKIYNKVATSSSKLFPAALGEKLLQSGFRTISIGSTAILHDHSFQAGTSGKYKPNLIGRFSKV